MVDRDRDAIFSLYWTSFDPAVNTRRRISFIVTLFISEINEKNTKSRVAMNHAHRFVFISMFIKGRALLPVAVCFRNKGSPR